MPISAEVAILLKLGPLPDESEEIADGVLEAYESIFPIVNQPVSFEEAEQLIMLFPPVSCYGLDWTLLHLIESTPGWPIRPIIEKCPSIEWRKQLLERADHV